MCWANRVDSVPTREGPVVMFVFVFVLRSLGVRLREKQTNVLYTNRVGITVSITVDSLRYLGLPAAAV